MKQIFKKANWIDPDNTKVFPFLNPKDNQSGLPFNLFHGFSIAAGEIEYGKPSKVHYHPFVTQVTFVTDGRLVVRMKETHKDTLLFTSRPYELKVEKEQAILTPPKAFLQLENPLENTCKVLYITGPEYLFLMEGKKIIYDDAIILDETWEQLAAMKWKHPEVVKLKYSKVDRKKAYDRLSLRKPSL